MKNKEKELLFQLLRNSKLSDREIAKKLKTSQSTITRNRHKLESKFIKSYTIVPNLTKLGINLIAFTLGKCAQSNNEFDKKIMNFIETHPDVVFLGYGEGMGKTMVMISFHNTFSDFTEFMRKARSVCSDSGETLESFIVSTDKLLRTLIMANAVEFLVNKQQEKENNI